MAEIDPAEEQDFADLVGFLQDPKTEVRRFAAEGLLEQTASESFLLYCQRHPRKVARPLLRLAERAEGDALTGSTDGACASASNARPRSEKAAELEHATVLAAGAASLQALINLATVPSVLAELIDLSAPRRCAEALRAGWLEGHAGFAHWHAMLLANLTTSKAGQQALCENEVLLRFLFAAFNANPRPPPADGYDDPLLFLGKVIGNILVLPQGRQILVTAEGGEAVASALVAQLRDRARRLDVLNALRNICMDVECHKIVATTCLMDAMASFLYPFDKVEAERREQLPQDLLSRLSAEGATLTGDVAVRSTASECILGLCRSKEGREYLQPRGCYEVTRAWHLNESEESVRTAIEAAVPYLHLSEEELLREQQASKQGEMLTAAPGPSAAEEPASVPEPLVDLPRVTPGPLPPREPGVHDPEGRDIKGLFDHIED